MPARSALDRAARSRALALGLLGQAALGAQLGGELGAPHGLGALVGRLAAALDQPSARSTASAASLLVAQARRSATSASSRAVSAAVTARPRSRLRAGPRPRRAAAASEAATSSSRRLRSSSSRSAPPAGAWASSPVRPSSEPAGAGDGHAAEGARQRRRASRPPRRPPAGARRASRTRAPGRTGRAARWRPARRAGPAGRPRARERRAARAPPRSPAPSSSCSPAARSSTTAAVGAGPAPRPGPARSRARTRRPSASVGSPSGAGRRARRNWLSAASSLPGLGGGGAGRLHGALGLAAPRARLVGGALGRVERGRGARRRSSARRSCSARSAARSASSSASAAPAARSRSASSPASSRSSAAIRSAELRPPSSAAARLLGARLQRAARGARRRSLGGALLVARRARAAARFARPPSGRRTGGAWSCLALRGCARRKPARPPRAAAATSASSRSASSRSGCGGRPAPRPRELRRAPRASARGELHPRLQRLALEALVQLGRLGLALERPQPRARLALHVERAREVLLGALELELRAPAALAVLAEPRGLLDHQPPLARARVDDRLDLALGDDRVHLLAEAGVREHLEHVDQPAACAVEPVLALAVAVEPAHDRDLGEVHRQRAVGVVDHHLDLGAGASDDSPWPPAKITSFIVWPRTASGLCSPSAQSTASVTLDLPEPLGPTTTDTPGANSSWVRWGKDLKPFSGDRAQVHQPQPPPGASACRAASCSARLLGLSLPAADLRPSTSATTDEAALVRRALLVDVR